MDWFSVIKDVGIPLLTLAAAFGGARWGRHSALREKIYEKQIEAYTELLAGVDDLYDAVRQEGTRSHRRIHARSPNVWKDIEDWESDVLLSDHNLSLRSRKHRVFIPNEVDTAIWEFRGSTTDLVNMMINQSPELLDRATRSKAVDKVNKPYGDVYKMARRYLGTDALIKEMNDSFGFRSFPRFWQRNDRINPPSPK